MERLVKLKGTKIMEVSSMHGSKTFAQAINNALGELEQQGATNVEIVHWRICEKGSRRECYIQYTETETLGEAVEDYVLKKQRGSND